MNNEFNHFDETGNAVMTDVGGKNVTTRTARASGRIYASAKILAAITEGTAAKGDVLGIARIAGIMAVKKTPELIPLAHPVRITKCSIDFTLHNEGWIEAVCTVSATDVTGVEMEALTGVSASLLTIYDMCKALGKDMVLSEIRLLSKTGGKSGDYTAIQEHTMQTLSKSQKPPEPKK